MMWNKGSARGGRGADLRLVVVAFVAFKQHRPREQNDNNPMENTKRNPRLIINKYVHEAEPARWDIILNPRQRPAAVTKQSICCVAHGHARRSRRRSVARLFEYVYIQVVFDVLLSYSIITRRPAYIDV